MHMKQYVLPVFMPYIPQPDRQWIAQRHEYQAFGGTQPNHVTILPFTRLNGGPMDFTGNIPDGLEYFYQQHLKSKCNNSQSTCSIRHHVFAASNGGWSSATLRAVHGCLQFIKRRSIRLVWKPVPSKRNRVIMWLSRAKQKQRSMVSGGEPTSSKNLWSGFSIFWNQIGSMKLQFIEMLGCSLLYKSAGL